MLAFDSKNDSWAYLCESSGYQWTNQFINRVNNQLKYVLEQNKHTGKYAFGSYSIYISGKRKKKEKKRKKGTHDIGSKLLVFFMRLYIS